MGIQSYISASRICIDCYLAPSNARCVSVYISLKDVSRDSLPVVIQAGCISQAVSGVNLCVPVVADLYPFTRSVCFAKGVSFLFGLLDVVGICIPVCVKQRQRIPFCSLGCTRICSDSCLFCSHMLKACGRGRCSRAAIQVDRNALVRYRRGCAAGRGDSSLSCSAIRLVIIEILKYLYTYILPVVQIKGKGLTIVCLLHFSILDIRVGSRRRHRVVGNGVGDCFLDTIIILVIIPILGSHIHRQCAIVAKRGGKRITIQFCGRCPGRLVIGGRRTLQHE